MAMYQLNRQGKMGQGAASVHHHHHQCHHALQEWKTPLMPFWSEEHQGPKLSFPIQLL